MMVKKSVVVYFKGKALIFLLEASKCVNLSFGWLAVSLMTQPIWGVWLHQLCGVISMIIMTISIIHQ